MLERVLNKSRFFLLITIIFFLFSVFFMWVTLPWMATVFGRLLKFILLVQGRSATQKVKIDDTEAYWEPCKTCKRERFVKVVNFKSCYNCFGRTLYVRSLKGFCSHLTIIMKIEDLKFERVSKTTLKVNALTVASKWIKLTFE